MPRVLKFIQILATTKQRNVFGCGSIRLNNLQACRRMLGCFGIKVFICKIRTNRLLEGTEKVRIVSILENSLFILLRNWSFELIFMSFENYTVAQLFLTRSWTILYWRVLFGFNFAKFGYTWRNFLEIKKRSLGIVKIGLGFKFQQIYHYLRTNNLIWLIIFRGIGFLRLKYGLRGIAFSECPKM